MQRQFSETDTAEEVKIRQYINLKIVHMCFLISYETQKDKSLPFMCDWKVCIFQLLQHELKMDYQHHLYYYLPRTLLPSFRRHHRNHFRRVISGKPHMHRCVSSYLNSIEWNKVVGDEGSRKIHNDCGFWGGSHMSRLWEKKKLGCYTYSEQLD